ncbi:hypothetical protein LTR09_010046 [Extremus antarcticus]|uniref:Coenzyme Q-binding protein COQ10 START domain-containing protein n=1 Tax=Extremus antarcticus TaxID=702011 RepID=A0AAJ0DEF5_9PEZI|nr:hypothetical protein LTR09_010046 [Extremus antarcticus]
MADHANSTWPPAAGLTTQYIPRQEAIMTISGSARINAPASQVFDAVLNVGEFGQWNTFCPRVTLQQQPDGHASSARLQLGTKFTFHVIMNSDKPQSENAAALMVCDLSTPTSPSSYVPKAVLEGDGSYTADLSTVYRVGWRNQDGLMAKGLRAGRFHEVIVLSNKECEVRTWELQSGLLVYIVKALYQKTLEEKFQMWCDDLKKFCEQTRTAEGGKV